MKRLALAFASLALGLVASCVWQVKFVGDYDEQLDQGVMELVEDAASIFGKLASGGADADYSASAGVYESIETKLSAFQARARALERDVESKVLESLLIDLASQFQDLSEAHSKGRMSGSGQSAALVRESSQEAMNRSFDAIIAYLVVLRKTQSAEKASGN